MTVSSRLDNMRVVRAPRGTERTAKSWLTEAPLRMLMNNLDPEVAERPERAGRLWRHRPRRAQLGGFDRDRRRRCAGSEDDETLLVQSGKPVGVFRTHADAPRVLIANSNLVPHWATWEHFHELDRKGLMMYGQMTAGSWIYIGSQGIVQGTYETFVEVGRRHYGGDLAGTLDPDRRAWAAWAARSRWPPPWPAPRCSPSSASRAASSSACGPRYLDAQADSLDEALALIVERAPRSARRSRSACSATRPRCCPSCVRARRPRPTSVTDQTSAHDPVNGYLPAGWTLAEWEAQARSATRRRSSARRASSSMARARPGDARLPDAGRADLRLRQQHPPGGARRGRRRTRSTSPASCPPTSARCSAAASGRSAGWRCRAIRRTSTRPTPRSRS